MRKMDYVIQSQNLRLFKNKLETGLYDDNSFVKILSQKTDCFKSSEVKFLEDYLDDDSINIKSGALKVLCRYGHSLDEYVDIIFKENDMLWVDTIINIAVEQKNIDILLKLLDEKSNHLNKIIMAFKKLGREDYLTTLMFSTNDELVKVITKMNRME